MWRWESSVPGAAGCGICGEARRAKHAAAAWMRAHGADRGVVEEIRLAVGAGNLLTSHEPTGTVFRARRGRDGRVRWRPGRSSQY